MPDNIGGDGFPPDNSAEKNELPKEGQIYREDSDKFLEPGFYKVKRVEYKQDGAEQKVFIHIRRIDPKTGSPVPGTKDIKEAPILFANKYNLVAENVEDFLNKQSTQFEPGEADVDPNISEENSKESSLPVPMNNPESEEGTDSSQDEETENKQGMQERPFSEYEQQKEVLEGILAEARLKFVQNDYEHSTQTNKLTRFFGLKPGVIPPRDPAYAQEYGTALKNLRDHEFAHLQATLNTLPVNQRKVVIEDFLLKYRHQEAVELYSLGKEVQSLAENETLAGKIKTHVKEIGNGYRQMSFKKKIAITVAVVGLGAVAGAGTSALAGIASAAYVAKRVLAGAAGYLATDEGLNKYLSSRSEKKARKESEAMARTFIENEPLYQAEEKAAGREAEDWEKLLEATNEKLKGVNKDLEKLKTREKRIKLAAFAASIGLPAAAHFFEMFEGATGGEHVEGPDQAMLADADTETGGGSVPLDGASETPGTGNLGGGLEANVNDGGEVGVSGVPSFEAVTVTDADGAKGLWGIVEKQLPENLDESEKNRVTASVQNLIQNKLNGLTDVQIQEQYGFSSRDINLIKPGEVIKLDALVNQQELDEIIKGKIILPVEGGEILDSSETVIPEGSEVAVPVEGAGSDAAITETPKAEAPSYINSEAIGFKDSPRSPNDQYWLDVRNGQGTYQDSGSRFGGYYNDTYPRAEQVGYQDGDVLGENNQVYSYEESRYQDLPAEYRPDWRENMTLLREELLDINHTEFGPNYKPGNWKADELWALYKGNSMQDIIAFDNPRYDYDPRDHYRAWEQTRNREVYFPPMHPEPQLDSGPDPLANYLMDTVENEYRHNISAMQRAAVEQFGSVAMPIGRTENVQQYMSRIATLYTRARLENPEFRLNF